jgi:hypothetical protein
LVDLDVTAVLKEGDRFRLVFEDSIFAFRRGNKGEPKLVMDEVKVI